MAATKTNNEIFIQFLVWRILIFSVALLAVKILPLRTDFTFLTPTDHARNLIQMWTNFDGVHYITLAIYGHGVAGLSNMLYAFFPVYPWLIRTVDYLVHNFTGSGVLISNLSFLFSLFILYKLYRLDFKDHVSKLALLLILIFPTSFFFGAVYTESLFLLLSVLTFYFGRRRQFFLAGLCAAVASATRVTGIFLWPALLVEFYLANGKSLKKMLNPNLVWLSLPPLGLLAYMQYQLLHTGSSIFFITSQALIGSNRVVSKIILLHQVFFRYLKMLIFVDHTSPLFFTVLLEFLCGAGVLAILILAIKKMRPSYWLFCFLSFLLPTLTGTFSSLPRYILILFPVFGFLAAWLDKQHPYLRYFYFIVSAIFSIIAVALFTRGYFVG